MPHYPRHLQDRDPREEVLDPKSPKKKVIVENQDGSKITYEGNTPKDKENQNEKLLKKFDAEFQKEVDNANTFDNNLTDNEQLQVLNEQKYINQQQLDQANSNISDYDASVKAMSDAQAQQEAHNATGAGNTIFGPSIVTPPVSMMDVRQGNRNTTPSTGKTVEMFGRTWHLNEEGLIRDSNDTFALGLEPGQINQIKDALTFVDLSSGGEVPYTGTPGTIAGQSQLEMMNDPDGFLQRQMRKKSTTGTTQQFGTKEVINPNLARGTKTYSGVNDRRIVSSANEESIPHFVEGVDYNVPVDPAFGDIQESVSLYQQAKAWFDSGDDSDIQNAEALTSDEILQQNVRKKFGDEMFRALFQLAAVKLAGGSIKDGLAGYAREQEQEREEYEELANREQDMLKTLLANAEHIPLNSFMASLNGLQTIDAGEIDIYKKAYRGKQTGIQNAAAAERAKQKLGRKDKVRDKLTGFMRQLPDKDAAVRLEGELNPTLDYLATRLNIDWNEDGVWSALSRGVVDAQKEIKNIKQDNDDTWFDWNDKDVKVNLLGNVLNQFVVMSSEGALSKNDASMKGANDEDHAFIVDWMFKQPKGKRASAISKKKSEWRQAVKSKPQYKNNFPAWLMKNQNALDIAEEAQANAKQ